MGIISKLIVKNRCQMCGTSQGPLWPRDGIWLCTAHKSFVSRERKN